MSTYRKANRSAQWFSDNYGSARMNPNCVCLHSTETTWWPGYKGGASAPNYTVYPDIENKRLLWRAHFEDEESSRALENDAGGVETNTANVIQVEMIGTCDPRHRSSWLGKGTRIEGRDYLYLPDAPEWFLEGMADFLRDMHKRHGVKLQSGLKWRAYPDSYGSNDSRMTFSEWRNFYGVCGHQHVPENAHGDPGNFPIDTVLAYARGEETDMATPQEFWRWDGIPSPDPNDSNKYWQADSYLRWIFKTAASANDRAGRLEKAVAALATAVSGIGSKVGVDVDEQAIANSLAAPLVEGVVAALEGKAGLTREDVEAAVANVLREGTNSNSEETS